MIDKLAHPVVGWICRLGVGIAFLISGLAKIGDLQSFAEQVHNFRLLPVALENLVAATIPWIELVTGLAMVSGVRGRAGAVLATGMMAVFTVAVASALARGLDFECGCFGTADATRVGWSKLLMNVGLLAAAAIGSLRARSQELGSKPPAQSLRL